MSKICLKSMAFSVSGRGDREHLHSLYFPHTTRDSLVAQLVKNLPAMQETQFDSWVRRIYWRRDRLPTAVFKSFPCDSVGKESACNAGGLGLIPRLGRSHGEGKGYHSSILAWRIHSSRAISNLLRQMRLKSAYWKTHHCNKTRITYWYHGTGSNL